MSTRQIECASMIVVLLLHLHYAQMSVAQPRSAAAIDIAMLCDSCHATIGDTVCLPASMERLETDVLIVKISIDNGKTWSEVESEINKAATCVRFTVPKTLRLVDSNGMIGETPIKDGTLCQISLCPFGAPCSGSPYKNYLLHSRSNSKQELRGVK